MDDQAGPTFAQRFFRFIRRFFFWICLAAALLLIALAFALGRWSVYSAHPELLGAEQASQILANVGKLIQLPASETPTMATINDAASAKKAQPFLANAENGDILIVYQNAAEALLYRPSTDKLIAVGPVDSGAGAPQVQAPAPAPAATSTNDKATSAKK